MVRVMDLVKLENVKEFKEIIDSTDRFLDEVRLMVDNDGMRFNGLTRNHTVFMEVIFDKEYFLELGVDSPYNIDIGTEDLLQILKMGKKGDVLSLIPSSESLGVLFDNDKKKTHKKFSIKLIDLDINQMNPPEIELPVNTEINYVSMKEMVADAELVNPNKFNITVDSDKIIIDTDGDSSSVVDEYYHGLSNINEEVKVSMTTSFLKDALRINIGSSVKMSIGTDMPLVLGFDNEEDTAHVKFMIAPRIEEE